MYELGLCSVSFRNHGQGEIMRAAAACGIRAIEWGSDVHAKKEDLQTLARIAAAQRSMGLKCSSYGTYFRIGETPITELEAYIGAANALGTNIVRVWCGNKNSEEYSKTECAELFRECEAAAKIAEKYGAVLCTECHGGTFTNEKNAVLRLLREMDSPHFMTYWQPNQFRSAEENLEYAFAVREHVKNVHVFNWSGSSKRPLSEAVEVWKKYLAALGGGKTLLLEFMPDGRIESLAAEADALRDIVGEKL